MKTMTNEEKITRAERIIEIRGQQELLNGLLHSIEDRSVVRIAFGWRKAMRLRFKNNAYLEINESGPWKGITEALSAAIRDELGKLDLELGLA